MVMDALCSPQSVGLEFVRQYYTLLNKAPPHLHRFYSNNSSFIHDGLESMQKVNASVVGQKKIHERIQELNFRDCHAKIIQVDSQATLGNGVVVQVSGELSNAGEPMRRFTQTFVLAQQMPRRYYVHNDIFRYQDLYGEEDIEGDTGRTDEEDQQDDPERTAAGDLSSSPSQNPTIHADYYGTVNNVGTGVALNGSSHHDDVQVAPSGPQGPQAIPPQIIQPQMFSSPIEFHHIPQVQAPPQLQASPQPPPQLQPPQEQQVAGVEPPVNQGQTGLTASMPQDVYQQNEPDELEEEEEEQEEEEEEVPVAPAEEHIVEDEADKQTVDSNYPSLEHDNEVLNEAPIANEPSTYATRLKSGTGSTSGGNPTSLNASPQGPAKSPSSPPPGSRIDNRNDYNLGGGRSQVAGRGGPRGGATVRGMIRGNERPGQQRPSPSDDGNNFGEVEKRRSGGPPHHHPDEHQLFLGNIPLSVSDSELMEFFGKYGNIVDLRILSKTNTKGGQPGGNKLPNYGFIIFDDYSTVQAVLQNRPFIYPPASGNRLNVEMKKPRARGSADGRMGSGDVRGGGGGPRMGPSGSSLRGGNRGGFVPGRGMYQHGRGGAPMRPGFIQRNNSVPR